MNRILAPVDGSGPSLKAAALAGDLAGKHGAELILLTVAPELSPALVAELEAYAHSEHIDTPIQELASASGAPAEEIFGIAREQQAGLIVLGSRGHGQLAGLVLGSVAQKAIAYASCPVLVVR
jgi:nucleotide-binding universal stress UspA family protein